MASGHMKNSNVIEGSEEKKIPAISTDQHDIPRHVTDDILQPLKLIMHNNLRDYFVVVVGIDDGQYLCNQLSTIIVEDSIKLLNDVESSLSFVRSLDNMDIFVVISGTLGQTHAREFLNTSHVVGIYIYCMDENKHTVWTERFDKIRCVVSNPEQLFLRLHADIKQLSGRWPVGEKSFQSASTSTTEWFHLFILIIAHSPRDIDKSDKEMFDECREYYKNNSYTIEKIGKFAQEYKPNNAIREYTRDNFVYRIINHALRVQNFEIIRKFSRLIRDIRSQLYQNFENYCHSGKHTIRSVYRGQYLTMNELEYLRKVCASRNPVITLTQFGSTSLNPKKSLDFVYCVSDRIPCLFEIIITDEYYMAAIDRYQHYQAFADVSSLSSMRHEQEVLFSPVTHFCVKYVGYPIDNSQQQITPIILELTRDRRDKCSFSQLNVISNIEKEDNPQAYNDILDMLQMVAKDEQKFNETNWEKWWNKLSSLWGFYKAPKKPLLLMFYDSFTQDKFWLRKAVEIHKDNLHSCFEGESNMSPFSQLVPIFKACQRIPTRRIAIYEEYLHKFCTESTKEVIECLQFAGQAYEMIDDKERALQCYQKALDLNDNDKFGKNAEILKRKKTLEKPSKRTRTIKGKHSPIITITEKEFSPSDELYGDQWAVYWKLRHNNRNPSIQATIQQVSNYLKQREWWYDAAESKIILQIPFGNTKDLTVGDYRSYFLNAVERYIMTSTTDASNNQFLSLWRYERYMHEWIQFKELENSLQHFQECPSSIRDTILPQLNQLAQKLSVLITLCTFYLCFRRKSGNVNMSNFRTIKMSNSRPKSLVFFDFQDSALVASIEGLQTKIAPRLFYEHDIGSIDYDYLNQIN